MICRHLVMSSRSSQSKLRRLQQILALPWESPDPCDHCRSHGRKCFFIADFSIMACAECTRRGRPCVTSSIARLDKVADDLAAKIAADEKSVSDTMDRIGELLSKVQEARARVARNKVVQEQNNRRLDEQVRHMVDSSVAEDENAGFSEAISLGNALEGMGSSDPFEWSWDPDPATSLSAGAS
jgi:hypothetical protein